MSGPKKKTEPLGIDAAGLSQVRYANRHPTNSVKALSDSYHYKWHD